MEVSGLSVCPTPESKSGGLVTEEKLLGEGRFTQKGCVGGLGQAAILRAAGPEFLRGPRCCLVQAYTTD